MSTEDINALLGLSPSEIVKDVKRTKNKLATLSADDLEDKIISETNNMIDTTRNALEAVLDEVQSTPNDSELIESAASLIKAQAGLVDALSKLHLSKEKNKNMVEIAQLRISAERQMNTENNHTKMLMSREEIMARLINDSKKVEVIDV